MVHTDSPLLAEAPKSYPKKKKEPLPTPWNWPQIAALSILCVAGAAILLVVLFHALYKQDPLDGYVRRDCCGKHDDDADYWTQELLKQERKNDTVLMIGPQHSRKLNTRMSTEGQNTDNVTDLL